MGSSALRNFDNFREWECINQQLFNILEPFKVSVHAVMTQFAEAFARIDDLPVI